MIRRLNANCRLTIASAMTLCTLLYGGCVPGYSASNLFEPASYDQLNRAEQVFFGKPNTTNSFLRRLDLLEVGIFGRVRSGSAEKRFDRISEALGLATMNYGTARPPGDLTKGLANHENRENAANGANSANSLNSSNSSNSLKPANSLNSPGVPEMSTIPDNSGSSDGLDARNGTSLPSGKFGDSGSDLSSNSRIASSSSSSSASPSSSPSPSPSPSSSPSSISVENFSSTSKSSPAENNHGQRDSSSATAALQAKSATGVKPGATPILSKETPKLEPQLAHKATDNPEHRIKRPAPGASNEIAHDKTKEVEELFKKGMSEFRDKRFAEAQTCFKKVLAIDPRNVDAYYNLGSLSETKHDYIDALTYYRAALSTKPSDSDFKTAVHAMEEELHKQHAVTATSTDHHSANSTVASGSKNDGGKDNSKTDLAKNSSHSSGTSSSHVANVGMSSSHIADVATARSHVADVGTTDRYAPEVTVGGQQPPIVDISSTDAPVVPVQQIGDKTFSLQTAQNGLTTPFTPMNGVPAPYQGGPVLGVPPTLGGYVPSNNNISQTPPNNNTRGTFNTILKIGANAALQGSGLHCPICRVLGGLH